MKLKYLLIISMLLITDSIAQTIYNPSSSNFFQNLESNTVDKINYNVSGSFEYCSSTLQGNGNNTLNFVFERSNEIETTFTLRDIDFSGYKNIIFWMRHKTVVNIIDCNFDFNSNGGIKFYFDEMEYLYSKSKFDTKILVENCEFVYDDLRNIKDDVVYQILFAKDPYPINKNEGKTFKLNNVKIKNCEFYSNNYPLLFKKHVKSIIFYRESPAVSFSNICVLDTDFDYENMNNAICEGIDVSNKNPSNFRVENQSLYTSNKNLILNGNHFTTDSQNPGHAIHISGPFDSVYVKNNYISGFGQNFPNGLKQLKRDGAVHIYGARARSVGSTYSDDVNNVFINDNEIKNSKSTGIRVTGFNNLELWNNIVEIEGDTEFWSNFKSKHDMIGIEIGTGDYETPEKQSTNALIKGNEISCNEMAMGIQIKFVKDFNIIENEISDPISWGILYFANRGATETHVGNSIIENNYIDMSGISTAKMKSDFLYPNYQIQYGGINFWRNNKQVNRNEKLVIRNNTIVGADEIEKIIFSPNLSDDSNEYLINEK